MEVGLTGKQSRYEKNKLTVKENDYVDSGLLPETTLPSE